MRCFRHALEAHLQLSRRAGVKKCESVEESCLRVSLVRLFPPLRVPAHFPLCLSLSYWAQSFTVRSYRAELCPQEPHGSD